jgi:SAM-dependent methyltransferase
MTGTDPKIRKTIKYYDGRVSQHGDTGHSTLLDDNMRVLEIETVENWLGETDRVLEVFCGNGVSTLEFATHCSHVVACDLSEKMIVSAMRNLADRRPIRKNVRFEQRNILDIDSAYTPGQFDTVVSIRGLINLPSRDLQKEAILKIHGLLPKNGKFIFIEGYRNGLNAINRLRKKFSLKPLSMPWYDNYFEEPELSEFLLNLFRVKDKRNLDIYFFVSRVLYPLACLPSEPEFSNICNTVARLLVPYARIEEGTTLLICQCLEKK